MRKSDMKKAVKQYKALQEQMAALEKQKEALAEKIKKGMGEEREVKVDDYTVRKTTVFTDRFDLRYFRAEHADLYQQYLVPKMSCRFSIV